MASEFSSLERRCLFGLFLLLATAMAACTFIAIRSGGWTSTPMSTGAVVANDIAVSSPPPVAYQRSVADLPTPKEEPLSPPVQSLVAAAPRPTPIAPLKPLPTPAAPPIAAAVAHTPIDASANDHSSIASSFTLDCGAGAASPVAVVPVASAAIASPTTVPAKPASAAIAAVAIKARALPADPAAPLALRTLPLKVVHVMTSETDNSEWYELKLNTSQASSLRDALLSLGSAAGADCDESDHLVPNTLPPALGVQWWLPGELTDLDLISLKTGGPNARRVVLALSARTGRAFLFASEPIAFPNE